MEDDAQIKEYPAEKRMVEDKPPVDATLTEVVKQNNKDYALHLLFDGADVNKPDDDGNTPLLLAVKNGNIFLVQTFTVFEADVNKKNSAGLSPRHMAAVSADRNKDVILHMLHISGAERCPKELEKECKKGCIFNGHYNGKPWDMYEQYLQVNDLDDTELANGETGTKDRVLCLDGGGIRGLILIQVLAALEKCAGKPVKELFDWIGGTSTGGILALGIGVGKTLSYMRRLYFQLKDKVFSSSLVEDSAKIESLLQEEFGEKKMTDIEYPKIVVTGTVVDQFPPKLHLFRSYQTAGNKTTIGGTQNDTTSQVKSSEDQLIWKCARSTSAAPTYFSHFERYIDGGLMANNPTLDVLSEIQNHYESLNKRDTNNRPRCVVSIGCGRAPTIPFEYSDVTILPAEAPDDTFSFLIGRLAKNPRLKKEIAGGKALISIIINQATTAEGLPVDRARAWCRMMEVPFNRFNPPLSQDVSLGCTDNAKLIKILWETHCYIITSKPRIKRLAEFLVANNSSTSSITKPMGKCVTA